LAWSTQASSAVRAPGPCRSSSATAVSKATQGRAREVSPLLWVIAALFVVYFGIDPIERALA
jgi:xanthine/uracil/vitamin C permease (AzgA family)